MLQPNIQMLQYYWMDITNYHYDITNYQTYLDRVAWITLSGCSLADSSGQFWNILKQENPEGLNINLLHRKTESQNSAVIPTTKHYKKTGVVSIDLRWNVSQANGISRSFMENNDNLT